MFVRTAVELSAYVTNGTCTEWHWCTLYLRTLELSPISSSATFTFVVTDCYIGPICRYEGAKGIHVTPRCRVQLKCDGTRWRTGVSEGGNWRMEWVDSTLHTTSEHGVPSITTADAHTTAVSGQVNWRPHRLARFAERRSLVFLGVCHHISNAVYNLHGILVSADCFELLWVPCRVTLDSNLRWTRFSVELKSMFYFTAFCVVFFEAPAIWWPLLKF